MYANFNITKNRSMLALAVYLIVDGLGGILDLHLGIVTPILALVAGVLILIGRQ